MIRQPKSYNLFFILVRFLHSFAKKKERKKGRKLDLYFSPLCRAAKERSASEA